jgi:hypothetical protein
MRSSHHITYLVLALLSCSPPPSPNPISEYYSSDRRTILILSGNKGYLGNNPVVPNSIGNNAETMQLLTPLARLPMDQGSCVAYESFTFAIKVNSKAGEFYQCNGVGFRVLKCDASRPDCRRFVIEARCFDFAVGKCKPEGEAANLTLSYRYLYDVDKGILALDVAPDDDHSDVLRLAGDVGFRLELNARR